MAGRRGWSRVASVLWLGMSLGGCAPPTCRPALMATLLFGLSRPGGGVDAAAFDAFLDTAVTPRFPAGLTVVDAAGRYRAADGRLVREPSKIVLIVVESGPERGLGPAAKRETEALAKLEAVRAEYRDRFQQESVGLVLTQPCVAF